MMNYVFQYFLLLLFVDIYKLSKQKSLFCRVHYNTLCREVLEITLTMIEVLEESKKLFLLTFYFTAVKKCVFAFHLTDIIITNQAESLNVCNRKEKQPLSDVISNSSAIFPFSKREIPVNWQLNRRNAYINNV